MSRLLLNNSLQSTNRVLAASRTRGATTTLFEHKEQYQQQSTLPTRRWKSLFRSSRRRLFSGLLSHSTALNVQRSNNISFVNNNNNTLLNNSSSLTSPSVIRNQSTAMSTKSDKFLQADNINPNFVIMEYAVRGPLVIRAGEIEKELQKGVKKPFKEVIRANIGDCHAMGQKPLTFLRQLLALTYDVSLFDKCDYPEDVKERARELLSGCSGKSVGSYTDSAGIEVIRKQVAKFIEKRDGFPSNWQHVFLTAGASPGIKSILSLLNNGVVNGKKPGIMTPIPQYPLYSATIAEYGMQRIGYYLEEETNWSLSRKELQRALDEGKKTSNPRAIVIINPGNPTGQVLSHDNIQEIIKFAYDNKLVILSDEVYQENIYDKNSKFHSFKKVIMEMGSPYKDMEIVSFLSTSKGYLGECGIRGGYMEIMNMDPTVLAVLTKSLTASLCGTTAGQVAVSAMVNPPQPGEPSYELWNKERSQVLSDLGKRAELLYNTMNSFEGYKLNVVQGAMYAFPTIEIPPKAIAAAKAKNMSPDTFYAFELLESTGICIVPGSGFDQKPGTYHFRTTILPQTDVLKKMLNLFQAFHVDFMKKYN